MYKLMIMVMLHQKDNGNMKKLKNLHLNQSLNVHLVLMVNIILLNLLKQLY